MQVLDDTGRFDEHSWWRRIFQLSTLREVVALSKKKKRE
jgi:hypothetical protein